MTEQFRAALLALLMGAAAIAGAGPSMAQVPNRIGAGNIYDRACSSCHGSDGRGRTTTQLAFATPVPDFTDCAFATREADGDWLSIAHQGGPVRAFDRMMPAFGSALSKAELQQALDHIRGFCTDKRWPRGEFNLPLALFTEKAFPEDELVVRNIVNAEGGSGSKTDITFEKRFGPRGQMEVNVPLVHVDGGADAAEVGVGDIGIGWKQTLYANLDAGAIVSIGGEVKLPTGDSSRGLGKGSAVLEPYVAYGQILGGDAFFQTQFLAEFPTRDGFDDEIAWRSAVGKTFAADGGWGRAWTPMLEVLAARELADGEDVQWDIVPQLQVSLSKRQHVLLAFGVKIPVTDSDTRDLQVGAYVLWDWFDGGFFEGWQ
ncbi:MAG TPA: c-type cytochrome [Hyphomonadaceae bacterium]